MSTELANNPTEPIDVRTEAFADFMADYPFASEVDSREDLPVQMLIADDTRAPFQARVLGFGSSYRESHVNHAPGARPAKGVRCSGCRWTDTAILWAQPLEWQGADIGYTPTSPWQYVYVTLGKSAIEGEWQKTTVVWTREAVDVLRKLFVKTKKDFTRDTGPFAIPPHNAVAFREAASVDAAMAALLEEYEAVIPQSRDSGGEVDPLAHL